jgi:hypothetical protein
MKLKSLMLPDIILKRRIHDDHQSVRNQHAKKDYVRIIKASLDRQRKKDSGENGATK